MFSCLVHFKRSLTQEYPSLYYHEKTLANNYRPYSIRYMAFVFVCWEWLFLSQNIRLALGIATSAADTPWYCTSGDFISTHFYWLIKLYLNYRLSNNCCRVNTRWNFCSGKKGNFNGNNGIMQHNALLMT